MDTQDLVTTAGMAYIQLSDKELETLGKAVEQMVDFFEKMGEVNIEGLQPTTHAFIKKNRLREDEVRPSGIADEMLEQAPDLEDRFICIPNVL